MSGERTLFEKLRNPGQKDQKDFSIDSGNTLNSIMEHLQKLLNSRHESVLIQDDYGIPDFNEILFSFPDSIPRIQKAIRISIEKYEPRLRMVNVTYLPREDDITNLHFEITAQVSTGDENSHIRFETTVASSGQIQVER